MVIGASCLTGTINCQIRKENPSQTLSDVAVDFYDVRPCGGRFVRTEGSLCSPATSGGRMALALGRRRDAEPLAWQALKDSSAYFPLHPSKARHEIAPTVSLTAELEEILHAHA